MKKLIMITGMILIGYLILMTTVSQPAASPSASTVATEESVADSEYLIGISDGRVTVFKDGKPMVKTDTQLSDLPKSDRVRLEEGIPVDSIKELKEKLEDYCS